MAVQCWVLKRATAPAQGGQNIVLFLVSKSWHSLLDRMGVPLGGPALLFHTMEPQIRGNIMDFGSTQKGLLWF